MGPEDPMEFYIDQSFLFISFADFSVFCWGDGKIQSWFQCFNVSMPVSQTRLEQDT
jgi:hypothetical protein